MTIEKQPESLSLFLRDAARTYAPACKGSPAERFLDARGLDARTAKLYGLGYVAEPLPGHERFRGHLAIPYLRPPKGGGPVVSIRFRCIEAHSHKGHGKYQTMTGDRPRLYNTEVLTWPRNEIAVTEGELDAIAATSAGVPAVGVPGAQAWRPHFAETLRGYDAVFVLADGDEPGLKFAETVAKSLGSVARVIEMPPGDDVNELVYRDGPDALTGRVYG